MLNTICSNASHILCRTTKAFGKRVSIENLVLRQELNTFCTRKHDILLGKLQILCIYAIDDINDTITFSE